ncbi:hypothetical protein [Microcoleus sp. N3A4]|uniref:hypothetical protein n=1 Tax=Microcoleus sp. N3A4 TaxID=3055379 RepID=UPI002FD0F040
MYDREGDCYGIDYFGQFFNELKKYDFAEILAYQAKFPFRYVLDFILSTPILWTKMSYLDWIKVMSLLNPRPKPFTREIHDTGYVDIHFLCKYIRVNAIEMFLQQKHFSDADKKKLLQYSNKVSCFWFIDELDLEDLDGDYFVHNEQLKNVKTNLISTGVISEFKYTEYDLKQYIEIELKNFK